MGIRLRFTAAAVAIIAPLLAQDQKPIVDLPTKIEQSTKTSPPVENASDNQDQKIQHVESPDVAQTPDVSPPRQSLKSILYNTSSATTVAYGDPNSSLLYLGPGQMNGLGKFVPQVPPVTQGGMYYDSALFIPMTTGQAGNLFVIAEGTIVKSPTSFARDIPDSLFIGIWNASDKAPDFLKGTHLYVKDLQYFDGSKNYRILVDGMKDVSPRLGVWGHFTRSEFFMPETAAGVEIKASKNFSFTEGVGVIQKDKIVTNEFGFKWISSAMTLDTGLWSSRELGTTTSIKATFTAGKAHIQSYVVTGVQGTNSTIGYDIPAVFPGKSRIEGGVLVSHPVPKVPNTEVIYGAGYRHGVNGILPSEPYGQGSFYWQFGLRVTVPHMMVR